MQNNIIKPILKFFQKFWFFSYEFQRWISIRKLETLAKSNNKVLSIVRCSSILGVLTCEKKCGLRVFRMQY